MAQINTAQSYELNLEEYWQVILRRRWIIIFCSLSIAVFSALFTWMNQPPALYSSSASIKIEPTLDVAAFFAGGNSRQRLNDMKTQLVLLQSYALMERVAQRIGMIPKTLTSEEIRANADYVDDVLDLKDSVSALQDEDTGIIQISVTSVSAVYARDLAQAVADEFQTFNIEDKNKKVFEAKKFIEQQLVVVGDRLRNAEESARNYRQKHHLTASSMNSTVMSRIIGDLDQEYRQSTAHLNDLKFALKQLNLRVGQGEWDYKAVSVSGNVSAYFDELNKRLVEMALKHTELSTNYTDEHPQIQELRLQAKDILSSMLDELAKQLELTQQRIQDIQDSIVSTKKKYEGVPGEGLDLMRLERSVKTNEELFSMLEKKYQEVLIKESEKIQEVSLVRPAMVSRARINPVKISQTAIAGMILGLVLGLVVSLVLESMDSSVGTIEEVEAFLDVPVIGFVPHIAHDEAIELFSGVEGLMTSGGALERQLRLVSHFSPPSTIAEAYRSLRTNLLFSQTGHQRVILVTSSTVKEGKSTIAANLSVVVAQQGARVLLIDADLRKPMQHHTFGLKRVPGLSEALLGQLSWQEATNRFSDVMLGDMGIDQALMTPGLDQLDILACGHVNANPPDLLGSPMMDTILNEAREEYDMVIIDMPPLLHTTDATVIASKVDGVLLVYHIGSVVRGALKRVKMNIENVGGSVLGVVLNGVRGDLSPDYATYKMDRYYAYAYGEHEQGQRSIWLRYQSKVKQWGRNVWMMLSKILHKGDD
ncbi:MAG: polysaccharide biosynthesis tyrosine autokinase [Mariprofundaceae bacterium]|nr:polysaccharide biosynthesis tyrosine autokinase [Mariprofundaceae bacterium]